MEVTRWRNGLAVVALAIVAPLAGSTVAHAAPTPLLTAVAKQSPARTVTAIAQFKPGFSEPSAKALVLKHGGSVEARVPIIHGLVVRIGAGQARVLGANGNVAGLTLNTTVHGTALSADQLATSYPKTIRADKLWKRGITGRGVGVAVLDTGVAGDAVDFKGADGNSRVIANAVTAPGAASAGDGLGHGTHVAGIVAGNSFKRTPSDPFFGKYQGVAPEANLIAIKASDDAGNSSVLDVINGIAFAVEHKNEFNIRVLNLSLSTDTPQSYKLDPLDAAVEYAWQKGIVVVAASGNRGAAADAVKYAPANDPYVISVGGVDESANGGRGARAEWSSTGRTQDGTAKPELMAPGSRIVSVLAPGSAFEALCPNCALGRSYFKAGGTSMAAPAVSGAAALLLQARPNLTPDQVKALLMGTDRPLFGGDGAGVIDVERALFTPTFAVAPANRGLVPNLLVQAINSGNVDVSQWTRSSWSAATGALAAGWARSSWSCTSCTALGDAVDPQRSSWSRSSWSSVGEDASAEAAQYAAEDSDAPTTGDAAGRADETPAGASGPTTGGAATPATGTPAGASVPTTGGAATSATGTPARAPDSAKSAAPAQQPAMATNPRVSEPVQ